MNPSRSLLLIALAVLLLAGMACRITGERENSQVAEATVVVELAPTELPSAPRPTEPPAAPPPGQTEPAPATTAPTARPAASDTPAATQAQAATYTPAVPQIPVAPLADRGPWLLIVAERGLFALNPDGSGLTHLTEEQNIDLSLSVSPRGGMLAYVTLMMPDTLQGLELFIMQLPYGDNTHVATLTPRVNRGPLEPGGPGFESYRAIYEMSPPVWSPDASKLAFMGAQDGPSSDLYVYTLRDERITRLTDGPSEGFQPRWSPDGTWIVHTGASTFGTGAGYALSGIWAARGDDSEVKSLYPVKDSADERLVGWLDADTFLVHSWDMSCGPKNLRAVSVSTKKVRPLWPGSFSDYTLAFDLRSGSLMFSASGDPFCNPNNAGGVYLIRPGGGEPQRVADEGRAEWDPGANLFYVQLNKTVKVLAFDPAGRERLVAVDLPVTPLGAPGGQLWAWASSGFNGPKGVWVGELNGSQRQIFAEGAQRTVWSPDGSTLFIFDTAGNLYAAYAPDFVPALVSDGLQVRQNPVWVEP